MSTERDIATGMAAQLVRHREMLAHGAEPIGWKIGFNVKAIQDRLGIDRPLAGFLSSDGLLEDGATWSLGSDDLVVESEVAVELGEDARTIVALAPALEIADRPDLDQGLHSILAGNIFHRAVVFGPRAAGDRPGAARIVVNGEEQHAISAEDAGAGLAEMVEVVAGRLADAGEALLPGQRIITGVLAPPHTPAAGDTVRLEIDGLGDVELHVAE